MQATATVSRCGQASMLKESDTIIEIGAEGGSLALRGIQNGRGWAFSMEITDWTPALIDEDWIQHHSVAVDSWEAALSLLDQYRWSRLRPIRIHPEFRQRVWLAVRERLQNNAEASKFALEAWRNLCEGLPPRAPEEGLGGGSR
jgi:hypothetical protein